MKYIISLLCSSLATLVFAQDIQIDAQIISSDASYQNCDWNPLIEAVKEKSIVALGEFNHGNKEVFQTRLELIKALHQELGFDLVLFESGLGEIGTIQLQIDTLSTGKLINGFFYGWRNEVFKELMMYARDNQMTVAGFDVQRTGNTFSLMLSDEYPMFEKMEKDFVTSKRLLSNYRTEASDVKGSTMDLIDQYAAIQNQLTDSFQKRVIQNRIDYLTYMFRFCETKDWNARWAARDQAMAENTFWLLEQFKGRKAIIIGHNFHIARYNKNELVMGELLSDKLQSNYFSLGVFGGSGSYYNNAGEVEYLSPPDSTQLDIKHIIQRDQASIGYLPLGNQKNMWAEVPIIVNDSFIDLSSSNQMNLSMSFDGLLLLDTVSH